MAKIKSQYRINLAKRAFSAEVDALKEIKKNPELLRQFAELVSSIRSEMGLARSEMAMLVETSPGTLKMTEEGRWVPKIETVNKIKLLRKGLNFAKSNKTSAPKEDS